MRTRSMATENEFLDGKLFNCINFYFACVGRLRADYKADPMALL